MRAIKRAVRKYKKNKAMRPALEVLRTDLQAKFGNPLYLKQGGDRGRDSVYNVRNKANKIIGVARLVNPQRDQKTIDSKLPYRRVKAANRLTYEWECCDAGFQQSLTPQPLWQNETAIMVSYCEGGSYQAHFLNNNARFWDYIVRASLALKQWHALSRVHMDASLTNVVGSADCENAFLIDFEYIAADHITAAQAKAYDYLRLVESSYKFVPQSVICNTEQWQIFLAEHLDEETKNADLKALAPAIERVYKDSNLAKVIKTIFKNHGYS